MKKKGTRKELATKRNEKDGKVKQVQVTMNLFYCLFHYVWLQVPCECLSFSLKSLIPCDISQQAV